MLDSSEMRAKHGPRGCRPSRELPAPTVFWLALLACPLLPYSTAFADEPTNFGAYYTKLETGKAWEEYARVGPHADIVTRVLGAHGELVFWRGNSYLKGVTH